MPSPRLRAKARHGHFLPIEDEVHGAVRQSDYRFRLTTYLLPTPGMDPIARRRAIETARAHELTMADLMPDGPDRPRSIRATEAVR